jgi:hypothetical protein
MRGGSRCDRGDKGRGSWLKRGGSRGREEISEGEEKRRV